MFLLHVEPGSLNIPSSIIAGPKVGTNYFGVLYQYVHVL